MVLPGVQALFGFQLIAVFQQGFESKLTEAQQRLHLAATALSAIAIALLMTPAALHRQVEPTSISRRIVRVSSRLLLLSMFPLTVGTALDFHIIASIVVESPVVSVGLPAALVALALGLWVYLPRRYVRA